MLAHNGGFITSKTLWLTGAAEVARVHGQNVARGRQRAKNPPAWMFVGAANGHVADP